MEKVKAESEKVGHHLDVMDSMLFSATEDIDVEDAKRATREIAPHYQKLAALAEELKALLKSKKGSAKPKLPRPRACSTEEEPTD